MNTNPKKFDFANIYSWWIFSLSTTPYIPIIINLQKFAVILCFWGQGVQKTLLKVSKINTSPRKDDFCNIYSRWILRLSMTPFIS